MGRAVTEGPTETRVRAREKYSSPPPPRIVPLPLRWCLLSGSLLDHLSASPVYDVLVAPASQLLLFKAHIMFQRPSLYIPDLKREREVVKKREA